MLSIRDLYLGNYYNFKDEIHYKRGFHLATYKRENNESLGFYCLRTELKKREDDLLTCDFTGNIAIYPKYGSWERSWGCMGLFMI